MNRREVIAGLLLPVLARDASSQQIGRLRRIGVLSGYAENDPEVVPRVAALRQGLEALGWSEGRNVEVVYRWTSGDAARASVHAAELVNQELDLIITSTTPTLRALQQATQRVPIVFVAISDPVGDGFVASLAMPGGNITRWAGSG